MAGLVSSVTVHGHHIQDATMVNDAVESRHGGPGIFENALPLAEHEIGADQHGFSFIAFGKNRKEHLHFGAIVLNVANIIEDDTGIFVQLGERLGQA